MGGGLPKMPPHGAFVGGKIARRSACRLSQVDNLLLTVGAHEFHPHQERPIRRKGTRVKRERRRESQGHPLMGEGGPVNRFTEITAGTFQKQSIRDEKVKWLKIARHGRHELRGRRKSRLVTESMMTCIFCTDHCGRKERGNLRVNWNTCTRQSVS